MDGAGARAWASAAWVVAVAVVLVWSEFGLRSHGTSLALGGVLLGVGFAATAVLLRYQQDQRSSSRLFVALTMSWVAGSVGARGAGVATQPLLWLGSFAQALGAAVFLRYPEDRFDRRDRAFVLTLVVALGVIGAGRLLTGDPALWDPPVQSGSPWLTVDDPLLFARWTDARDAVWAVGGGLLIALVWRRWRRLGTLERRALVPILTAAGLTTVFTMTAFLEPLLPAPAALAGQEIRAYSASAVALGFVYSAVQLRLARAGVADLVADLAQNLGLDAVRDALRRRLGDEDLQIWYWLPQIGEYVDGSGTPRTPVPDPGPERTVHLVTTGDGSPLAAVVLDARLRRHPDLVAAALAVSRYALENARLQADLRRQVAVVRETRSRLLHSGLEQRRRLERDLHDGAQQRLLAIGLRLGVLEAQSHDEHVVEQVQQLRRELGLAQQELRDLAHGLYPATLTQAGLGPAVEAVVERLPVPVRLHVEARRWPADLESTAYLIACETLSNVVKHAGPCTVDLVIGARPGLLVVDVRDDGTGSERLAAGAGLSTVRDRCAAAGGRLTVHSVPGGGTHVVAELPCASP